MEAMRRYSFDVEKLSRLTGIPERFINALIEERWGQLPPVPYARGYLRKVSEILNLNSDEIWQNYLKDRREIRRSGRHDRLPANRFALNPLLNRSLVIFAVIIFLLIVYFILLGGSILGNTEIQIFDFSDDYLVWSNPEFVFRGRVAPLAALTINGSSFYPDEEGYFEIPVRLQPGLNNFEFKAKKILGREGKVIKQIFYQTTAVNGQ